MTQQIEKQKQLAESKHLDKKRIHRQKEHEWYERLKLNFNCHIVGYEQEYSIDINGKKQHFRIDVYGKDINGNEYLVECGDIPNLKKLVLEELQKKNSKIRFIHDPYNPNDIELNIQKSEDICMSAPETPQPELACKSRFSSGIGKMFMSILEVPDMPHNKNRKKDLMNRIKTMKEESEKKSMKP